MNTDVMDPVYQIGAGGLIPAPISAGRPADGWRVLSSVFACLKEGRGLVRTTASVMCLMLLGACGFFRNAPETHATGFVRALIVDPGNSQLLQELANVPSGQDPASVVHGLSTEVALNFLQTRERQGEKQKFAVDAVRLKGSSERIVAVRVSRIGGKGSGAVSFRVVLRDVPGRGWLVTAVSAE